ncbi:unnamed protein product [Trichogramma brassicae]|uniref:Uncharacterized protein n=1 Tax=Trichogramma brassicae TaxID=86971 RepID=A0A6H5IRD8_9HYME|nr:unnamed protein product [Trichogramma brassicae]
MYIIDFFYIILLLLLLFYTIRARPPRSGRSPARTGRPGPARRRSAQPCGPPPSRRTCS